MVELGHGTLPYNFLGRNGEAVRRGERESYFSTIQLLCNIRNLHGAFPPLFSMLPPWSWSPFSRLPITASQFHLRFDWSKVVVVGCKTEQHRGSLKEYLSDADILCHFVVFRWLQLKNACLSLQRHRSPFMFYYLKRKLTNSSHWNFLLSFLSKITENLNSSVVSIPRIDSENICVLLWDT